MAAKAFFMLLLAMCFQLVSGSFMYSCEDKWILMESHIMRAICRTKGQARQASELDLGFCYQNANGYLAEKYK